MRRLFAACITVAQIATLVVATTAVVAPEQTQRVYAAAVQQAEPRKQLHTVTSKTSREIFGYALSGNLGDPSWGYTTWNWSLLSTVAYFGLRIATDGNVINDSGWATWNSSVVTGMMNTAHSNGAKVVVSVILHDFSAGNATMCAGLANRAATVAQIVGTMRARGADGVNLDYEGLNGTCPNGETARSMMTDLVRQARAGLGSASYLSVATYASSASDSLGFFDVAGMSPYVDSFFVMAYDLEYANFRRSPIYCVSFCLGPTAPLTGYYYNDTSITSEYTEVVPASQVILGVPYYGRKSCVSSAALNPYPTTSVTADTYLDAVSEVTDPSVRPGSYVSRSDAYDPVGQERWNTWFNTSLNCERELYIDDAASLGKKYDLVNSMGLRGVGIWTLDYGGASPELWSTLSSHFGGCTGLSVSSAPSTAATVGNTVTVSAAAGGCPKPLYEFWILPPGGTWTLGQAYSTSPNFRWPSAGKASGSYRFSVWARNSGNSAAYDTFDAFQYTMTPACPTVSVSTSPANTATVGNSVTVSSAARGCPNPLYEFWVLPPGGAWTLGQAYSRSPNFKWITAGKDPGGYRFSVWARDSSSPGSYDAFSAFMFTLAPVCSNVGASSAPASTSSVGNTVTVKAAASGCPNPLYEFWVLPPSGSWTLAQAYSSSPTLKWASAAGPAGAFRFSVWVRDASSPSAYDAFSAFVYTLAPVCSAVSVSTTPALTASVGNTLTVAASPAGCPNPLYEFWILAPGGTWTLAQAYSTSPSLKWPSAGRTAGSYRFSVWVRDAGSSGAAGAAPNAYDAFNAFVYTLS